MREWLRGLQASFPDLDLLSPAPISALEEAESAVGPLPEELRDLLTVSNGLTCRAFRVYSAFDRSAPKKTWESLQRANDPEKSDALGGDADLHARFLVFADIGRGYAMICRDDWSIWFVEESEEEIRQTDLTFRGFIETMIEHTV